MFRLNKNEILTLEMVSKIIQTFETTEKVKLNKYYDYFKGNQAIQNKTHADASKPCNKITKNYCNSIVNNYLGYITGKPITYNAVDDISNLMAVLNLNDYENADSMLLRNALIFGIAYEIHYVDENVKTKFKVLDSREIIPVYDDTLNEELLYMIRYFKKSGFESTEEKYIVEIYDAATCRSYEVNSNFSSFVVIAEVKHYFKQLPFVEFKLNVEGESIFDKIISMQDAYNTLLSSEVDDFQAFTDAYLVLKGVGMDAETAAAMRENRILIMDKEDSAEYLTKNISDTQIENMLKNLNDSIHVMANCPDFNDEKFMAASGIAIKQKLTGFENTSAAIVSNMTKALQKRIKLIYNFFGVVAGDDFKDVTIKFTRNLPTDNTELLNTVSVINTLRGMVSNRKLLELLPFINDVDAEIEALKKEKSENINLYSFGGESDAE